MSEYHNPVLLKDSIDSLLSNADGIYVDLTYGGGGHSNEILKRLSSKGKLIAFDQDDEARRNLTNDKRLIFVNSNYRHLYRFWKWFGFEKVDGVLADLGVSSHQFDAGYRGFSYRFNADLDMRMNQESSVTARSILKTYTVLLLQQVFSEYGEIRNSKTLARELVSLREKGQFVESTFELNNVLDGLYVGDKMKYFSQVYQALRIEVNDEIGGLKDALNDGLKVLRQKGRFVVISYHSLEDRLVKKFFKTGNVEGRLEKDLYGNSLAGIKMEKKIIVASAEEQAVNVRSRSAKMRVATKL